MIDKMQKILILGPEDIQEKMTSELQDIGVLQVEDYKGKELEKDSRYVDTSRAEEIMTTYKNLLKYASHAEEFGKIENCPVHSPAEIINNLAGLEKDFAILEEEVTQLKSKRESFKSWGDFKLGLINEIKEKADVSIQFWELNNKLIESIKIPENIVSIEINHNNQKKYFMTFCDQALHIDNCLEIKFDDDPTSVTKKINKNKAKQKNIFKNILCYYSAKDTIYKLYLDEINKVNYQKALSASVKPLEGLLFAIQGWCPEKKLEIINDLIVKKYNIKVLKIEPEKGESIPTYITNKGYSAMGQDLVEFYDTPSYKDWDPSFWLFGSFTVFFAMIMGDGGYGILLFLLMLFFRFKQKKGKAAIKRFLNMSLVLTFATAVYGILSGGFFGVEPANPIFGWIVKLQLFNAGSIEKTNLNNMMRASILIGMIHISLSLILNTFRLIFSLKKYIKPFSNIAWIVVIWTFFFMYGKPFWSIQSGLEIQKQILYICAAIIFLTSAGTFRPGKLIAGGLGGWYNGVQFFSDVLSYIRIFALGLSGSLIAMTFNNMAYGIWLKDAWFLYPMAVIIFILGHGLNIALCIMSAVIHGLRLNYLEYYRWSFDGGGRKYQPLKRIQAE